MLTSLKNRNYLNEKIDSWNQNTIYPQAIIVIDLNNLKYINDTFGHEEGDRQIKSSAGILIKTQLDNTEIMRTDGNEFMVYLVGYNEKQVINYIKKLLKELTFNCRKEEIKCPVEEIKNKAKRTFINKYGVTHYSKTDEYKSKTKNTYLSHIKDGSI